MQKFTPSPPKLAPAWLIRARYVAACLAAGLVLPLLLWQGRQVRRRVVRLPGAAGPAQGLAGDSAESNPIRLLVLGESTVAGVGARTHEVGLAGQVGTHLAQLLQRPVAWTALGQNGLTAQATRLRLLPQVFGQPFDLVVVALGANDTFRLTSPGQWERQLAGLVRALRQQVGFAPILLATVPPVGQFPALPQPLRMVLGWVAQSLGEQAKRFTAAFGNVFYSEATFGQSPDYFCPDGVHPSEMAYAQWGTHLANDLAIIWLAHLRATAALPRR
jgi:lysophospholipase L1-like esterase